MIPQHLMLPEIDDGMKRVLEMEDPNIVIDLSQLRKYRQKSKIILVLDECQKFLREGTCAAVDDRRHQVITHITAVVSVLFFLNKWKIDVWMELTYVPSIMTYTTVLAKKQVMHDLKIHYTGKWNVEVINGLNTSVQKGLLWQQSLAMLWLDSDFKMDQIFI